MTDRHLLGHCNVLVGHPTAAQVLYRMLFWPAHKDIGDRRWAVRPYSAMMQDLGLSYQQVKDAVARLKKQGLISTLQHRAYGRSVLHVMVTQSCLLKLQSEGARLPKHVSVVGPADTTTVGPADTTTQAAVGSGDTTHIEDEEGFKSEGKMEEEGLASSPSGSDATQPSSPVHEVHGSEPPHTQEEDPMKASEVMQSLKAKKLLHKPDTVQGFWDAWMSAVKETYGSQYFGPLTMKDKGQIKQVIALCPEGKAPELARHVVENWLSFTGKTETEAGAFKTPTKPTLSFLLKHVGIAMNMAYDAPQPEALPVVPPTDKPKPPPATPVKPVQSIAQAPPAEDQITSLAQLLAEDDETGEP